MPERNPRRIAALDRVVSALIGTLIVGSSLAFGGAVWWAPAAIAALIATIALASLAGALASGRWTTIKSPLAALGVLAIGLAAFQSTPLPADLAEAVSPTGRAVHAYATLPDLARADDPDVVLPEPTSGRSPATIDRPATLRWIGGAGACLVLFGVVSGRTDRLGRLGLVWGSVVAAFLVTSTVGLVQLVGEVQGLHGSIEPGRGPAWGPSLADALAAPGEPLLRPIADVGTTARAWLIPRPDRPRRFGTLMGGPGAILALGSIALPLALAIALHLMAPRGSRDGLWRRLAETGRGGLLVLLVATTLPAAGLVGMIAGPRLALPFAAAILVVGLVGLAGTGIGLKGLALTGLVLAGLGVGVAISEPGAGILPEECSRLRDDLDGSRSAWADAIRVAHDFPIVGVGLGAFPAIEPYYKATDAASTTAKSSLLQWAAEAGLVGLGLLGLAAIWVLVRLPGALRRVGTADRALAAGMLGALGCVATVSAVHWTIELPAVAIAAAGLLGTADRWLAGGTDLFVERE